MNAVEVTISWGDQVLFLAHVPRDRPFIVGEDGPVDFAIPDLPNMAIPLDRAARHELAPVVIDVVPLELGDAPPTRFELGAKPHIAFSALLHALLFAWLRTGEPTNRHEEHMEYFKQMLVRSDERDLEDYDGEEVPNPDFANDRGRPPPRPIDEWGRYLARSNVESLDVFESIEISPRLDVGPVHLTIIRNYNRIAGCYRDSTLIDGWLTVGFDIGLDGSVVQVWSTLSTLASGEVQECILETFRSLQFPRPPQPVRVLYPVNITP